MDSLSVSTESAKKQEVCEDRLPAKDFGLEINRGTLHER